MAIYLLRDMSNQPPYPSYPDIPVGDQPGSTPWPLAVLAALLIAGTVALTALATTQAQVGSYHVHVYAALDQCIFKDTDACVAVDEDAAATYTNPNACDETAAPSTAVTPMPRPNICLVPVGGLDVETINSLVTFIHEATGLQAHVLPPIAMPSTAYDATRDQFGTFEITDAAFNTYADNGFVPGTLLIAVTPADIYLPTWPQWRFVFGQTGDYPWGMTVGVISTYEMASFFPGWSIKLPFGIETESDPRDTMRERAGKLLLKYVGLHYLHMAPSSDPHSVLYNNILSVRDIDRMSDRLPQGTPIPLYPDPR